MLAIEKYHSCSKLNKKLTTTTITTTKKKDDANYPIKHTKIQLEDGRWRIEFIPIGVGLHQIQRLIHSDLDSAVKAQCLLKTNVLHYSAPRTVYGYKMYNLEDSVQLVFDAANYRVKDIMPEVKGRRHARSILCLIF